MEQKCGEKFHIYIHYVRWKFHTVATAMWLFTKAKFILRKRWRTHCEIWVNNMEKHCFLFSSRNYFYYYYFKYFRKWLMKKIWNKKRIMTNCCSVATQFKLKSVFVIVYPYIYSNIWKFTQISTPLFCG